MKSLLVLCILLLSEYISASSRDAEDEPDSIIKKLIEKIPKNLFINDKHVEIPPNKFIKGSVKIVSTTTRNLNNVNVTIITYNKSEKEAQLLLTFPHIVHSGVYENDVTMASKSHEVHDRTNVQVVWDNLVVAVRTHLDTSHVWKLEANSTVTTTKVSLNGLFNDNSLSMQLSIYLSQNLPDFLATHEKIVSKYFSPILEEAINKLYRK